jgi:ribonuclease T2
VMSIRLFRLLTLAAAILTATAAWAQLRWDESGQNTRENIAGKFDYYALVLSWSPTHCSLPEAADDNLQCNRSDGKRYAFVLHGLWPQYKQGWPEDCRTPRRPFVPDPVITGMLDIMPSRGLIIHEYRKHGTCSGLDVPSYFQLARQLFRAIRIPSDFVNPQETQFLSPDDVKRAFLANNPGLRPDAVAIVCGRGNRARLTEVRICVGRDGKPTACGPNEDERKLCSASEITIPPVRSTMRDENTLTIPRQSPLPGPR